MCKGYDIKGYNHRKELRFCYLSCAIGTNRCEEGLLKEACNKRHDVSSHLDRMIYVVQNLEIFYYPHKLLTLSRPY